MLLFPYKLDAELAGVPIITTLLGLLCALVYFVQENSWHIYEQSLDNFCQHEIPEQLDRQLSRNQCLELFVALDFADSPQQRLQELLQQTRFAELSSRDVEQTFARMQTIVADPAARAWWYVPGESNPLHMLSASLTHTSLRQLGFNLLFFFAFGISAELILGHFTFLMFLGVSAICANLVYSLQIFLATQVEPTLGLSGPVTATMLLVTLTYPQKFLRIFFWLVFISGTFRLPLLLVSVGYISSDFYAISVNQEDSRMNYAAHVGGAMVGVATALWIRLYHRLRHKTWVIK